MATNWLMELTKLAKSDSQARELLRQLKNATTTEEKEKAKENGKEYIQTHTEKETGTTETDTNTGTTPANPEPAAEQEPEVETDMAEDQSMVGDPDVPTDDIPEKPVQKIVEKKYDMSEPAFNPRLARMGITREEELFQQHVYVRKLTREEKFEIRRSIYQKKKQHMRAIQEDFAKRREEQKKQRLADPEYQKFVHQQKFVVRIVEALKAHCNIDWMLKNIDGLTVDVVRELLQKPANVNKFREQKEEFVPNFYKRFGK